MTIEEKIEKMKVAFPGHDMEKQIYFWKFKNSGLNVNALLDSFLNKTFTFFILRVGYSCNSFN